MPLSRPHLSTRLLSGVLPAGVPGVRSAVHASLARLFGPPSFDPAGHPGDPGLTGPGSASWRVIGDPAAIAGGLRALLLQIAHPLAMAGVADHSAFRTDPLGRLQRTSAYVTASTFGSTPEALDVARRVRRTHPHVRGVAPDGRAYRADDPRLLTWVAVTLTASFLAADAAWSPRPVAGPARDAFVREQSAIAALLDPALDLEQFRSDVRAQEELRTGRAVLPMLERGDLPATVSELAQTLDDYRDELGVNHQGREALRFLRWPPLPVAVRPAYLALLGGAAGLLESHHRAALELRMPRPVAAAAVAQTDAALTLLRTTTGHSPSVRAARRRAARARRREEGAEVAVAPS